LSEHYADRCESDPPRGYPTPPPTHTLFPSGVKKKETFAPAKFKFLATLERERKKYFRATTS
jgi:hypothetical protein